MVTGGTGFRRVFHQNVPTHLIQGPSPLEMFVRPFVSVESFFTPRVAPEVLPPEPEAFVSWGGPSEFDFDDSFKKLARTMIVFKVDDGDAPALGYDETVRQTEDVRIENPDDPEQFVIVQRIKSIDFNVPGGQTTRFRLRNP
jgi:hypothetical protein